MAVFASFQAAETRAKAKSLDGTWINAHAERNIQGTLAVRLQRPASPSARDNGAWVELTDDATV